MSRPRIAHAKLCDKRSCSIEPLLVRGDRISFVSVDQVEKVGEAHLDEKKMPSDIVLGKNFVLVEDPSGTYLERCDFYIVRWSSHAPRGNRLTTSIDDIAKDYFGDESRLVHGSVDIPKGPWQRVCEVAFIRYRRAGYASGDYEHPYDPPVVLFRNEGVPAFKLSLPSGCVVDERGFVTP